MSKDPYLGAIVIDAATAAKNGTRVIAVIFGSTDSKIRDANARHLLSKSLTAMAGDLPGASTSVAHGVTASIDK